MRGVGSHSQRDARKKNGNLGTGFADRAGDHAARNVGHHQGWKGKMGGLRTRPAKSLWTTVNLCCLKATKCAVSVTAPQEAVNRQGVWKDPSRQCWAALDRPCVPAPSPVSKDPKQVPKGHLHTPGRICSKATWFVEEDLRCVVVLMGRCRGGRGGKCR